MSKGHFLFDYEAKGTVLLYEGRNGEQRELDTITVLLEVPPKDLMCFIRKCVFTEKSTAVYTGYK